MVDIEIARIFGDGAAMGDHDGFLPKLYLLVSALFVGPDDEWLALLYGSMIVIFCYHSHKI